MADLINRQQHESEFSAKMSRLFARHRRELAEHLGNPPDIGNVPSEFWQRVQRETEEQVFAVIVIIMFLVATQHGLGTDEEGRRLARTMADQYAQQRAKRVAQGFVGNAKDSIGVWADGKGSESPTGDPVDAPQRMPKQEIEDRIGKVFGPGKASQVAVNETTAAVTRGSETGVHETVGLDEDDTWFTMSDTRVCPVCEPLHGNKRSEWTRLFPEGPPAHVGWRCWVHYTNEKRGKRVLARR